MSNRQLARQLTDMALNNGYDGQALRNARKLDLAPADIELLRRFETGSDTARDCFALQDLANKLIRWD